MEKKIPPIPNILAIEKMSQSEFDEEFFAKCCPIVIKNAMTDSQAFREWDLGSLKGRFGNENTVVGFSNNGIFDPRENKISYERMSFAQAIDKINGEDGHRYYIQRHSLIDNFPELLDELPTPEWIKDTDIIRSTNIWIGGGGCITPLHYDTFQNFFIQLSGKKKFTLFSPYDSEILYPDSNPIFPYISKVNIENVDHEKYPLFREAKKYELILLPGDLLYLPAYWWHQVASLDVSLSVNFWWRRFEFVEEPNILSYNVNQVKSIINFFLGQGLSINHTNYEGETNLLKACDSGHLAIAQALLELGADPSINSTKYQNCNALDISKIRNNEVLMDLLRRNL
ncbi:cupin-like domain-containing protein [Mucilaginibacter sp. E4BP6]|uniref:cupin-like domain-containing protein n=1 Tax=Mucilaginibacter sp. E4BP6 TaxID=2723089 RepID=UPI0015C99891|nr:cupin-like domain-containing protein [Mucilaginibacter sp. E4BP6]NYE68153.1 hypothetical protein [Mucilaginibacter sp. E4BP6]